MKRKMRKNIKLKSRRSVMEPKKSFNKKNIPYIYLTLTILLINVAFVVSILLLSKKLPLQVPLYYGLPRGELQLASPVALVLPLLFSSTFITLNSILAYFAKSIFLKKALVIGSLFTSLLSIVTITKIVLLMMHI